MVEASADSSDVRQVVGARIAVSIGFFMFGIAFAVWAVHIPIVTRRLGLDPATLGLALLNVGLGGVISQPLTGWVVTKTGSRPAATVLLFVFMVAFIIPIIAWSTPVFFLATLILGLAAGACNVAINTQASEIESARGRPTMSSFHGFFSLGALIGATLGGGIIAIGWQDGSGAAAIAAVSLVIVVFATRSFLPASPPPKPQQKDGRKRIALPGGAILGLAVLTFFSNMIEGSVNDWSALYLTTMRAMTEATAASGFALFSLTMAVCRLAGGPVVERLGEKRIVLLGGVVMAVGMALVVLSPWAVISPFGFALVAIGAANTIPVMMGAASRAPGVAPSAGVAVTATGALLGFLIGPPIIGFMAQAMGLAVSLGLLSLAGVFLVIGAALYHWPARVLGPPTTIEGLRDHAAPSRRSM